MNPSNAQETIEKQCSKCVTELEKYKNDFENAVSGFLSSYHSNYLLVETKDSRLGAIQIMQVLEQLKQNGGNEKVLSRFLGAENQTFLNWKQLLDIAGTAEGLPTFTNLLVCMFPDHELIKTENIEQELLHKISDRLKITVLKKIVFITSQKEVLPEHLKNVDTTISKIEEVGNKIPSIISVDSKALLDTASCGDMKAMAKTLLNMASCGDVKGVEELIRNGVDVNITTGYFGLTALHGAASKGHTDVVLTLLRNGADILHNDSGDTPLHSAAQNGHPGVVLAFLENGVDVDIGGDFGQTALFSAAARTSHRDVIQTLLKYNPNVNAQIEDERSRLYLRYKEAPLHCAVLNGMEDIVLVLLENGADIGIKNGFGQTALFYARSPAMIAFLLNHGENIEVQDDLKQTPLHTAATLNHLDVIKTLLYYGADLNARDKDGYTPFHHAVRSFNLNITEALIELGADIRAKGQDGKTAMNLALQVGDTRAVALLEYKMLNGY